MAKNKKNTKNIVPLLVLLPLVAVAFSSYAVYRGIENYITTSSYFNVRDVKVDGITDMRYIDLMKEEILGINIFRINTRKLSERIMRKFPTFSSVTATRVLPSQLSIVARERMPVAVIRKDAYYLFDTEGVVIARFSLSESPDFPSIAGFDNALGVLRVGVSYPLKSLKEVLHLARVLRISRFAIDASLGSKMKITRIDAHDPSDLSFYLGETLQVRVGSGDFDRKIGFLPSILKSLSSEIGYVKYIDLRPKEPAVAMKEKSGKR